MLCTHFAELHVGSNSKSEVWNKPKHVMDLYESDGAPGHMPTSAKLKQSTELYFHATISLNE
jgi:hypothetical protein